MFDKPVLRDTAANSSSEILRRLALVAYFASLLLVSILGVAAMAQRNAALLAWTLACAVAFIVLHLTRRFWKDAPRFASRPAGESARISSSAPSAAESAATRDAAAGRRPRIVILNAALGGEAGNTAVLLAHVREQLALAADVTLVPLAGGNAVFENIRHTLEAADAFVIGTGTHWDSWSSVLQTFLEDATDAEGTELWLGKPVACVVTEHSVGGKGVLSRLQGVLVTLGCALPPMSGLVLSRAAHVAAQHDADAARDFWCVDDLAVVCHNLLEAVHGTHRWQTWPVDRSDFRNRWLRA